MGKLFQDQENDKLKMPGFLSRLWSLKTGGVLIDLPGVMKRTIIIIFGLLLVGYVLSFRGKCVDFLGMGYCGFGGYMIQFLFFLPFLIVWLFIPVCVLVYLIVKFKNYYLIRSQTAAASLETQNMQGYYLPYISSICLSIFLIFGDHFIVSIGNSQLTQGILAVLKVLLGIGIIIFTMLYQTQGKLSRLKSYGSVILGILVMFTGLNYFLKLFY